MSERGELRGPWVDHFSHGSAAYRRHRPTYPPELFAALAALAPSTAAAWDGATGNGQAAVGLGGRFARVIASDPSASQIAQATRHPRVRYFVGRAEESALREASVDLVTVAQAIHWFDLDRFYREVERVAKPGAVLAAWCYDLVRITPGVDRCVDRFYTEVVGPHWPKERAHVESHYRELPFPFEEVAPPRCTMRARWNLGGLLGYVETWSALKAYREARRVDPLPDLAARVAAAWGDSQRRRGVVWPLYFRIGRVWPGTARPDRRSPSS